MVEYVIDNIFAGAAGFVERVGLGGQCLLWVWGDDYAIS